MAISSIIKQNTINYKKQTYQTKYTTEKEQQIDKEQQIESEEHIKQNENTEKKDIFEIQQQYNQTANQNKQKNTNSVDYKPTEDLIKLMQAKTISEVRSIIGRIQGQMAKTKASSGDAEQIKNAVAKMKKVIKKAQNKEKALKLENKMEIQMKMKQKNEAEEAKEIGQQLQSKRKNRMSKEISDVLNSTNDFSGGSSGSSPEISFMDTSLSMPDVSNIDISV